VDILSNFFCSSKDGETVRSPRYITATLFLLIISALSTKCGPLATFIIDQIPELVLLSENGVPKNGPNGLTNGADGRIFQMDAIYYFIRGGSEMATIMESEISPGGRSDGRIHNRLDCQ
jgi:hypothetical protein